MSDADGASLTGTRPERRKQVAHRRIEDRTAIVDPVSRKLLLLNEVGSLIWELSDGTRPFEAIVGAIVERFDVDEEAASRDAEGFVRDLESRGVLSVVAAAPGLAGDP